MEFYTQILPTFLDGSYHGLKVPIGIPANHSIPDLFNQYAPGTAHRLSPLGQRLKLDGFVDLTGRTFAFGARWNKHSDKYLAGAFVI